MSTFMKAIEDLQTVKSQQENLAAEKHSQINMLEVERDAAFAEAEKATNAILKLDAIFN